MFPHNALARAGTTASSGLIILGILWAFMALGPRVEGWILPAAEVVTYIKQSKGRLLLHNNVHILRDCEMRESTLFLREPNGRTHVWDIREPLGLAGTYKTKRSIKPQEYPVVVWSVFETDCHAMWTTVSKSPKTVVAGL